MNIVMDHTFRVPREQLWNLLLDPSRLVRCIPGCEKMDEVSPNVYAATLKIGVASIKGTYLGHVEIGEIQFPSHYRLSVKGSAGPGYVRGVASMDLAEQGERETLLSLKSEAEVGGFIASVGQRFLGGIARQMVELFFQNIEKELLTAAPADQAVGQVTE